MTKVLISLFLSILLISCGSSDAVEGELNSENQQDSTSFEDNTEFKEDIAAYKTVVNVIRETGLAQNFVIIPGNVKNVVAYVEDNERILEYNPDFMQQLEGDTNWHGISVLAREIGHHLSNHELNGGTASPKEELEADRYAGFVLQKMGASLQEAIEAMEKSAQEKSGESSASLNARIAALSQGWNNSELLSSDTTLLASSQKVEDDPKDKVKPKGAKKEDYVYQIFLAVDTTFYYINDKNVVYAENNKKYSVVGQKKDSNKPGFDWIFIKGEDSYGVDANGRLWAFSTDGKFHVVGQSVKLKN